MEKHTHNQAKHGNGPSHHHLKEGAYNQHAGQHLAGQHPVKSKINNHTHPGADVHPSMMGGKPATPKKK